MRQKYLQYLLSLLAALLFASHALAADNYAFDKTHSQILFFVNHLGFSNSQGEFHDYEGGFTFDPADWSRSSVEVTVRTASIDMDDYAWDKHLRAKDFFDVRKFPEMRYQSIRVEQTGEKTGKIYGELTLLGVTRPVVLDLILNKVGLHPMKQTPRAGFSATTRLKRSDFGMKYAVPMVSDEVEIRIEVEGPRQ